MLINVIQTHTLDNLPLLYSPIIFLSFAIKVIIKIRGTAITPFITEA